MAYFKILPIQKDKYTDMGMINIDAQLFLEKGDDGYDKYIAEHYVQVPVIPEGGYQGKVDEEGLPVDKEDYQKWLDSLEKVWQLNPFCTHSIQFEHDVTEEEILWCFEFALGITHRNYLIDDLHCKKGGQVVNQTFGYSSRRAFYQGVSIIPENNRTPYMEAEMAKVDKTSARLSKIKDVDFTNIQTIGKYKVK